MKEIIQSTDQTPEITIDKERKRITFKGVMIPENPVSHFSKLSEIIFDLYNSTKSITLEFELEYFNTGSAKYLFDLLQKFNDKSKVKVIWIFESDDEDILEAGKDFEELTGINFEFVKMEC